jgi:hypothetical protein
MFKSQFRESILFLEAPLSLNIVECHIKKSCSLKEEDGFSAAIVIMKKDRLKSKVLIDDVTIKKSKGSAILIVNEADE